MGGCPIVVGVGKWRLLRIGPPRSEARSLLNTMEAVQRPWHSIAWSQPCRALIRWQPDLEQKFWIYPVDGGQPGALSGIEPGEAPNPVER
jgi:hypothetical protein